MSATRIALAAVLSAVAFSGAQAADQPKSGGVLHVYHRETPPSMSIHEEATFSVNVSSMPIFNNLVVYDQHKPQNSMGTIVPELAESWSTGADNLSLTFKLRQGVKWHDGKPFTAADVKCTFDMIQGKSENKFRKNPRKDLFSNI
jgi:peptide/nickel transport system substrate-binding protein